MIHSCFRVLKGPRGRSQEGERRKGTREWNRSPSCYFRGGGGRRCYYRSLNPNCRVFLDRVHWNLCAYRSIRTSRKRRTGLCTALNETAWCADEYRRPSLHPRVTGLYGNQESGHSTPSLLLTSPPTTLPNTPVLSPYLGISQTRIFVPRKKFHQFHTLSIKRHILRQITFTDPKPRT